MNIEQIADNKSIQNDFSKPVFAFGNTRQLQAAKTFSFELELPDKQSSDDPAKCLEELEIEPEQSANENIQKNIKPVIDQTQAKLLKNLQDLALKDKIPVQIKDVNGIRLLIFPHDLSESKHKLDLKALDDKDIKFLKQCIDTPNIVLNSINPQTLQANFSVPDQSGQVSYKSLNFSKGLFNMIEYAYKTQKPVRLDFEGNSSVILKVDVNGKLSAEFISSDKAMEQILKSSIPNLRNKLDSEGIPYKEIVYKENQRRNNQNNHNGGTYE